MTPDEIRARIALRPADEPLDDSLAHAAYWALVELHEAGGTSTEKAALIRDFALVKDDLLDPRYVRRNLSQVVRKLAT